MPYYQQTVLFPLPDRGNGSRVENRVVRRAGNYVDRTRDREVNSILSYLR